MTALTKKLAALAAQDEVFVAGARVIAQEGGAVAMAAILRVVDDTVLERTLLFSFGDMTLSVIVAGRRMRGLLTLSEDIPGVEAVLGQPLSPDEPEILQVAGALLNQLCEDAKRVSVQSMPMAQLGVGSDAGISASGLANIWNVDFNATPKPPVARFLAANAKSLSAHLSMAGDRAFETFGDTAPLQTILDDQLAAFQKHQSTLSKEQSNPLFVSFDGALGAGTAVVIAVAGDDLCLCSCSSDQMANLAASWQMITG